MIGEVVAPGGGLDIEVEEILKAAAGPEALAQEADRPLDAALFVSPAYVAGEDAEATRLRIFHEAGIEDGVARRVLEHHRFHIIEDIDDGAAAVEAQAVFHAAQERRDRLADGELDVEVARVAERHHEGADAAWAAGEREAEVGPVDLHGGAGLEVESEEGLARVGRAQAGQVVAQDGDAAGIAERAQTLEHRRGSHLRRVGEEPLQLGLEAIEQRSALRRSRLSARIRCAAEEPAHRPARHREPSRDRTHALALDQREPQHLRQAGVRGAHLCSSTARSRSSTKRTRRWRSGTAQSASVHTSLKQGSAADSTTSIGPPCQRARSVSSRRTCCGCGAVGTGPCSRSCVYAPPWSEISRSCIIGARIGHLVIGRGLLCLSRQLFGTMIPHARSVGALVLAVVEASLLRAPVPRPRCSGCAAAALPPAGHAAVDLPVVARAADPELAGAHAAVTRSMLQRPSASGGFLDADVDSLHAPVALTGIRVRLAHSGIWSDNSGSPFSCTSRCSRPSTRNSCLATFWPARLPAHADRTRWVPGYR